MLLSNWKMVLLVSPLALGAQLYEDSCWILGGVALVPLLSAVQSSSRVGHVVIVAFGLAVVSGCISAPWLPDALMNLGATSTESLGGWLVVAAWVKAPWFISLAVVVHATRRTLRTQLLLAPACIFAVELWMSSSHAAVPWALLGHGQYGSRGVAQLAVTGGVPLISALLVAVNCSVAAALAQPGDPRRLPRAGGLIATWLALAVFGMPISEFARRGTQAGRPLERLLVVQPNLPYSERWNPALQRQILDRLQRYTKFALAQEGAVDLIVWPENALTSRLEPDGPQLQRLGAAIVALGTPTLGGFRLPAADPAAADYRSVAARVDRAGRWTWNQAKARGVPVFESAGLESFRTILLLVFGAASRTPKLEEAVFSEVYGHYVVAICYEALFAEIIRSRRSPQSLAILNLADDSWVDGTLASHQLTRFAAFRAIESRLPFVRVTHGGPSVFIDEYGVTRNELKGGRYAHMAVDLHRSPPVTRAEQTAVIALPSCVGGAVWCFSSMCRMQRTGYSKRRSQ